jgi:uncharacterized protein YpmB
MLNVYTDNFFTGFPQKLWKTLKSPIVVNACLIMLSIVILSSCSYFKGGKKQDKTAKSSSADENPKQTDQKLSESPQTTPEKKAPLPPKEPPKAKLVPENGVIGMTEAEVKKKFGEPDIVSKTPDNRIIWTYQPTWKLLPDNKGTIYVEFENGKVVKIIRAR